MIVAAAVNCDPYDVASRIDPKATVRLCSSGHIDGGKISLAEEKTMVVTAAVDIEPYDVALRVNPFHIRESGARFNDGHKRIIAQQKTVNVIATVTIFTRDIAFRIDPV